MRKHPVNREQPFFASCDDELTIGSDNPMHLRLLLQESYRCLIPSKSPNEVNVNQHQLSMPAQFPAIFFQIKNRSRGNQNNTGPARQNSRKRFFPPE